MYYTAQGFGARKCVYALRTINGANDDDLIRRVISVYTYWVPKLRLMSAFPPDAGDGDAMTPVAPDNDAHVVLLPVRGFLLHTIPETEHRGG